MREETIKIYKFEELSEDAQSVAIENTQRQREEMNDFEWLEEYLREYFEVEYGIEAKDVYWDYSSISNCGIKGFVSDYKKFYNKIGYAELSKLVEKSQDYEQYMPEIDMTYDKYMTIKCSDLDCLEFDLNDLKREDIMENLPRIRVLEVIRDTYEDLTEYCENDLDIEIKRYIYNQITEVYENSISEENIKEDLIANEIEFNEDGKVW